MFFLPAKLTTLFLFLCLFFNAQSEGINFQQLSLSAALKKAEKEHKKVFIDVYAVWCGPCRQFTPMLASMFLMLLSTRLAL